GVLGEKASRQKQIDAREGRDRRSWVSAKGFGPDVPAGPYGPKGIICLRSGRCSKIGEEQSRRKSLGPATAPPHRRTQCMVRMALQWQGSRSPPSKGWELR